MMFNIMSLCYSFLLLVIPFPCVFNEEETVFLSDPLEDIFGKIQYAALLVRHGDRNPLNTYPNDPFKNYKWPGGKANLNEKGKSKQYELGKWMRNRYNHLVTGKWEDDRPYFKMHASDTNRTRQSGMYLQYGFYRLSEADLASLEVENWEPVEIQVIPKDEDNVIGLWRQQQCKYFLERKEYLYSEPTVREKLKEQDSVVTYIAKHAGYDFTNTSLDEQYDILADLYDTLKSQTENGVKLPDWATEIFPQPFRHVANSRIRVKGRDPVSLRFTAGPFLKILVTEMKEHIECCGLVKPTLHFFMGHDYISMVVMSALGIFNDLIPPYANAILFELRKKGDIDIVMVSLKNTTAGPIYLLEIPACGPLCPFETFSRITENCHIFQDWDGACSKSFRAF